MSKFGKWLGGGLGWAMFGPIGGIIGFAFGSVLDDSKVVVEKAGVRSSDARSDFTSSLLVLCAAVMRADGNILKSELEFVKAFFVKHFGVEQTREDMLLLREILKQDIPVQEVCGQIRQNMEYASRVQLLHFLYGIAAADGQVMGAELQVLEFIARALGIQAGDADSVKHMFVRNNESNYRILEIEPSATDEEVKKAYRRMAVRFHPDKVSHLGEEYQQDAKEKFQKVQEAYENIRKTRGIA